MAVQSANREREAVEADAPDRRPEFLTGIDALVRLPLLQRSLDLAAGLDTSTVISGYPGSPLGGLDLALEQDGQRLAESGVHHVPGLNEELAAATVWGSQMRHLMSLDDDAGVVGLWYGKSPGVDRSGDVFKHANSMGVARNGGVLVLAGDDPGAKSSTLPNDSRGAFFDAQLPVLVPGSVAEVLELGLHSIALSRFTGLWVGMKVVTDIADGFESLVVGDHVPLPRLPQISIDGRPWKHAQAPVMDNTVSVRQEGEILNGRLQAARAYCLANGLNRITHAPREARVGIAAAGKAHAATLESLAQLGLEGAAIEDAGIRILKVSMPYPLEPTAIGAFAEGLDEILVVEEKRPFLETFVRDALYAGPHHPTVVGKRDEDGEILVPAEGDLTVERLLPVLHARLSRGVASVASLPAPAAPRAKGEPVLLSMAPPAHRRMPTFCSGCPHNRSTAGTAGTVTGGGVGCHSMVYLEERHKDDAIIPLVPMGAEGAPWIGAERFVAATHMFQNLGDGTLSHSGSLAIRACVAAGVNVTFKVLYNSAIAMTGAQDVPGAQGVPDLTRELEAMGLSRIVVVADDESKYGRRARWAKGTDVWSRDRLPEAEAVLAATPGVTALIYDQRCAAQARRLWRRGALPEPRTRVVINEAVCEGCGDCQRKSNCMSVVPVDTELGRKTQVEQSSCNHDLTCLEGDCPSFITVETLPLAARGERPRIEPPADLPAPELPDRDDFSVYMVGIGGTGVVTASRILGVAATGDGWNVAGLDQTGLSQKGGTVTSHLRARRDASPHVNTVGRSGGDLYFAFDPLSAAEAHHLSRLKGEETTAVVSTTVHPTTSMVTQPLSTVPRGTALQATIDEVCGRTVGCDAQALSEALFGDEMQANVLLLGMAFQAGLLPFSRESFERAIDQLGRASQRNLDAFAWGRAAISHPDSVAQVVGAARRSGSGLRAHSPRAAENGAAMLAGSPLGGDTRAAAEWRAGDLVAYQHRRLAKRYLRTVEDAWNAEARLGLERTDFSRAVAFHLYKLMAYKDEYEVARLHLSAGGPGAALSPDLRVGRVRYLLHPPILRAMGMKRKLRLAPAVVVPLFRVLKAMRRVRGTAFDVFGHAEVRRVERWLVADYVERVERLAAELSPGNYERAVELVELPDVVRGYEEIKLDSVRRYKDRVSELEAA